ncbi:fibronectin type III domain-containing protein [Bacillus sp. JCM 19034]|uniref:fibronectin type III domain-containing protein n=1 Tax=Bacillus sp. JCM 19034 TaxID=1481928 RepID=UPI000785DC99|nr:fibronectin type III domain-containing protein [Bacillus sp. JCM 19034]
MRTKKLSALFLTLIILFSSFFSGLNVSANEEIEFSQEDEEIVVQSTESEASEYTISGIAITPGRNESELNFAWYSPKDPEATVVQFATKTEMTGDEFPVEAASTYTGTATDAVAGFSSNKVTVTDLVPNEQYVYRLGDGNEENWSPVYDFQTHSTEGGFDFLMFGDPQIGAGNVTADTIGWNKTVTTAVREFPNANFLVSVGDQVEVATNERHYDGYFTPEPLKNYAVATVQGNHDNSINYQYHFNTPNHKPEYISTVAGGITTILTEIHYLWL